MPLSQKAAIDALKSTKLDSDARDAELARVDAEWDAAKKAKQDADAKEEGARTDAIATLPANTPFAAGNDESGAATIAIVIDGDPLILSVVTPSEDVPVSPEPTPEPTPEPSPDQPVDANPPINP